MNTSSKHFSAHVDWSAVKGDAQAQMSSAVADFVRGIRGKREGSVTQKQIVKFFHGTPQEFVCEGISRAIEDGKITISRTSTRTRGHRRKYLYTATSDRPAGGEA